MCPWYIIRYLKGKLYFIFAVLKQAIILLTSSFSLKVASDGSWNISGLCPLPRKGDSHLQNLILLFRRAQSSYYGFVGRGTGSFLGSVHDDCWICFQLHKEVKILPEVFKRNSLLYTSCELPLLTLTLLFLLWFFSTSSFWFCSWSNLDLFCSFVPRCKIFHLSFLGQWPCPLNPSIRCNHTNRHLYGGFWEICFSDIWLVLTPQSLSGNWACFCHFPFLVSMFSFPLQQPSLTVQTLCCSALGSPSMFFWSGGERVGGEIV